MPGKHKPSSQKPSGALTSGYHEADGILENNTGKNIIQAKTNASEITSRMGVWIVGKTIPNSSMPYVEKEFSSNKLLARHNENGDNITTDEMVEDFESIPKAYGFFRREYKELKN